MPEILIIATIIGFLYLIYLLYKYKNECQKLKLEKETLINKLKLSQKENEATINELKTLKDENTINIAKLNILQKETEELKAKYAYLSEKEVELTSAKVRLAEIIQYEQAIIQRITWYIEQKCDSYPHLAGLKADMLTRHYEYSAEILRKKKNPALKEANRISELSKETKEILKQKIILEYKLAYLKTLYPNIEDAFDPAFDSSADAELETDETTDRVRKYLTHEQYVELSTIERNQLALDNYIKGKKTNWQIGRDYELYIGYLCEKQGYDVEYSGIFRRLQDMGRDLIVKSQKETFVIQCKNWAQEKELHENHIFQLYGSVVMYRIENPFFPVKAVLVTTTKLSHLAEQFAQALDIDVKYVKMGEFPRIKCNIGKDTTGAPTKIYHLPFDQQYDKTQIINEGECYAWTVAEAEGKEFRRAHRWNG
ncbi:MAG: restriction endonuclease [Clostridia bacterium]|nr:restriction endonuclease [Clostridia bacterium]